MFKSLIAFLIVFFVVFSNAYSQEIAVPLDTTGKIISIDREMSKRFNLYPEYNDLKEVSIYQIDKDRYALEIFYRDSIYKKKSRTILDENQYKDYKLKLSEKLYSNNETAFILDKSGRGEFLFGATVFSLTSWSIPVPLIINSNSGAVNGGSYLLSAGIGFLTAYAATNNANISEGMARFANYGGILGTYHGITAVMAISGEDFTETGIGFGMLFGSVGEFVANYNIAKNSKFSLGKSSAIGTFGLFGAGFGPLLSGALGFYENDGMRSYAFTSLGTSALGYLAGAIITEKNYYYDGDANLLSTCGLIGGAIPASIFALIEGDDYKVFFAGVLAGSAVGLGVGDYFARKVNLSESQGNYISLAMLGGGLVGAGVGLLASQNDNYKLIPLISTVGATGLFAIVFSNFWDETIDTKFANNLKINFNPVGFASMFNKKLNSHNISMPLLNINYLFK